MALVLALAACGPRASAGPAWPKSQDPEKDGGESLAPRESGSVAAIEAAKDEEDEPAEKAKPAPKAESPEAPVTPAPTPAPTPTIDDLPITEEIIIEIEED